MSLHYEGGRCLAEHSDSGNLSQTEVRVEDGTISGLTQAKPSGELIVYTKGRLKGTHMFMTGKRFSMAWMMDLWNKGAKI